MTAVDVLVIGAGPAGIAAATAAAERGREVIVLDDNPAVGGQIWRAAVAGAGKEGDAAKVRALERLRASGARVLGGHRAFDADGSVVHALRGEGGDAASFRYGHLILATGAREMFVPFPGWTLPGVFGAGGLQALVKGGYDVAGKRVLVAGTGPLLLAVAAHLRAYGAEVAGVVEQAPWTRLGRFGASLWRDVGKVRQGFGFLRAFGGARYRAGCWPTEAIASEAGMLRAVRVTDGKRSWEQACDLLACGFHLVPNTEFASLLGCAFDGAFVRVDEQQRTSLPNVFCVGEPTGIAGLDAALVQGEIAGLACLGGSTAGLQRRAAKERVFGKRLSKAFALRPELRSLARADTVVCRCEDVVFGKLAGQAGWTEAKLQTRCGMGPCQGRVCGPAVEFMLGWKPGTVRPPVFPVPLAALCKTEENV